MNSLGLLSLVLGIISVVVTLKYVKTYENLDTSLDKINANCQNKSALSEITKIQDSLNLSDKQMNKLLRQNRNTIRNILKKTLKKDKKNKEGFVNYNYTDDKQRGLDEFKFTGLIKN